ncbi:MAG: hypothetical protein ACK4NC_05910 [Candidatus Gracilibacteria bacterium]
MTEEEIYEKYSAISPEVKYKADLCKYCFIFGTAFLFFLGIISSLEYEPMDFCSLGFVCALVFVGIFEVDTWRQLYEEQTKRRAPTEEEKTFYMDNLVYSIITTGTLGAVVAVCAYEGGLCVKYGVYFGSFIYLIITHLSIVLIIYNVIHTLENLEEKIKIHKTKNSLK